MLVLAFTQGSDHAGKGSRTPGTLGKDVVDSSSTAHMQHCNFCLKRLSLQISLTARESLQGCLHKPDISLQKFP